MKNKHFVKIFTRMRELLIPNRDILQKLIDLESQGLDHDRKISLIFKYLEQLREPESERQEFIRGTRLDSNPKSLRVGNVKTKTGKRESL